MIVCGLEGVGLRTVEQLRATGVAVVVVDDDAGAPHAATVEGLGLSPTSPPAAASRSSCGGRAGRGAGGRLHRAATCATSRRRCWPATCAPTSTSSPTSTTRPSGGRSKRRPGAGSALDVAGLFAPAVVDACMYRSSHDVLLGDERFVAAEVGVGGAGTLRELFGDLVPVGVVRPDGELVVCPGRDLGVAPGDRVTLLGKPEELAGAELSRAAEPEPVAEPGRRHRAPVPAADQPHPRPGDRPRGRGSRWCCRWRCW